MYGVWLVYGATCVNAWFWSTVFHTRDIAFTEMMDYFCAFSIVLFSLLAFLLRSIAGTFNNSSLLKFLISGAAGILKYYLWIFIFFYVLYYYIHPPPLRFHCVGGSNPGLL
jgi:hypothetical protein